MVPWFSCTGWLTREGELTTATEILDADISHWAPGTRFYGTDDGRYFVVCVDITEAPEGSMIRIRKQPTVILYTDSSAVAEDMVPDFTSEPGTDHETACAAAGFTLE